MTKPSRRSFLALTAACAGALLVPFGIRPRVTKARMAALFGSVEMWDDRVEHIWIHPSFEPEFRTSLGPDTYDRDSHWQLRNRGIVGFLWGATVFVSPSIPYGDIRCLGTVEADRGDDRRVWGPSEAAIEAADRRWMAVRGNA